MTDLFGDPISSAVLSACGKYRYRLTRSWNLDLPVASWVMLNPSTASENADDPTIRRCVNFAKSWGCGGIDVLNLFALRATDPRELRRHRDPVGPDNDNLHLAGLASRPAGALVLAAWGACDTLQTRERARNVFRLLKNWGVPLHCLKLTKHGDPQHPLFVRGGTEPVPFGDSHAAR